MEKNKNEIKQIDLQKIVMAMYQHKRLYLYILPIVLIVSSLLVLCVPRYYQSTVKLAPELSSFSSSSLNDIASTFGFEIGGSSNNGDAIFPELYPDLIASNDFVISLFYVQIKTKDNSIKTNYYDYMLNKQKAAWWSTAFYKTQALFMKKEPAGKSSNNKANPFMLDKMQDMVAKGISNKIVCDVDKKNYVISITVEDQDPLVAATMADTVKSRLQDFITNYRTKKARNDYEYVLKLSKEAKMRYERARQAYGAYADTNQDVILQSYKLKTNDLENEMQLQYNNYTSLMTQLEKARAKVLEQTPAFTTLQSASVPIKPSGPKRMRFVLSMVVIAFVIISLYATKDNLYAKET